MILYYPHKTEKKAVQIFRTAFLNIYL